MTVQDVLSQITYDGETVISKSTGRKYSVKDFVSTISSKLKFTSKEKRELEDYFSTTLKAQSEKSCYVEKIIEKYNFKFSDGVYMIDGQVITLADIYRKMWREEKLLPTECDEIIENIEKISEPIDLQAEIFTKIYKKQIKGKSLYLQTLRDIYPNICWENILYNILVPNTKPMFHIFYDDGVGGTGKSTLLEVLTKIVGEDLVSNVLLDQFSNRFVFSNMLGKYLNVGDDNGKNDELQNVGTLKSIITGNRVTIDRKNISPIEVRIFAKQLFATNILPYIDFTDGGIMRRLNIVKMNKVIPRKIKLPDINEEEIGHIVYEVLNSKDLCFNSSNLAIESHPLYRFIKNGNEDNYVEYKEFCENNGFRKMNIINYEVKTKFIKEYLKRELTEYVGELVF